MPDGTGLATFAKVVSRRATSTSGSPKRTRSASPPARRPAGCSPVCAIYSTFLQRAYDQVVHDVSVQNLPVIFAMDRAGFVGDDGPTHMGLYDIAYMRTLPNMTLMAPRNESEIAPMLDLALGARRPGRRSATRAATRAGNGTSRSRRWSSERPRCCAAAATSRSWRSATPSTLALDAYALLPDDAKPTVVNMRFVRAARRDADPRAGRDARPHHHARGAFAGRRVRVGGGRVLQRLAARGPGRTDRASRTSSSSTTSPTLQRAQFGLSGENVAARVTALRAALQTEAAASPQGRRGGKA